MLKLMISTMMFVIVSVLFLLGVGVFQLPKITDSYAVVVPALLAGLFVGGLFTKKGFFRQVLFRALGMISIGFSKRFVLATKFYRCTVSGDKITASAKVSKSPGLAILARTRMRHHADMMLC